VLIDAELDRDNSGTNFVLRAPGDTRPRWKERLGIGPRSTYSFTLPPRDDAGGQVLADLTSRGINLVANAAAQSADHIGSYFTMLRAELGFYVSCLNLADRLAAKGVPTSVPEPRQPTSFGEDLYYRLGGWLDEDKAFTTTVAGAASNGEPGESR
jgi:hypothetical protein